MGQRVEFFDWSEPALRQAVAFLLRDAAGTLADLSDTLILVPTRHAGRRLREAMARAAADRGGAVLIGRVDTPPLVFQPPAARHAADGFVEDLAWCGCLRSLRPADFPSLFSPDADFSDPAGILRITRPFARLRSLLCEEGLRLEDVSGAKPVADDADRWKEFVRLESAYLERIGAAGFRDGCLERLASARRDPPPEWRRVILLFCPDPPPLAIRTLERWARSLEVVVCIHAPNAEQASFDEWGRPVPERWIGRDLNVPEEAIRQFAGPADQTAEAAALVAALPGRSRSGVALGLPDRNLAPAMASAMESRGMPVYDPEGRPAHLTPPISAALALLRAARPDRVALDELLGRPDVIEGCGADPRDTRLEWDALRERHLPSGLEDVLRVLRSEDAGSYPALCRVFRVLVPFLEKMQGGNPAPELRRALSELYRDRKLTRGAPRDDRFAEAAEGLRETLDRFEAADPRLFEFVAGAGLSLLIEELSSLRLYPERESEAVDLLGWLELHWDDAPVLLLVGLSEGVVPETVTAHPFLPGRARDALGLRGNDARFARDAYLFTAMLRSRKAGAARILLSSTDARGEPRHPSRLLLQCGADRLPERALRLFSGSESPASAPAWTRSFRWKPPAPDAPALPAHWAVTALRDYLDCPFRFFLRRILKMDPLDPSAREMDALAFGSACHDAWQRFGENSALRDCADERQIADFLRAAAEDWIRRRFGPRPAVVIQLQQEALMARLAAGAGIQALERAAGWRIEETELDVEMPLGSFVLRGRIDRVDRNEKTGEARALDYKTTDSATPPDEVHLRHYRGGDPEWALVTMGGKRLRWRDLQLPLYARMLRARDLPVASVGYFLMPKAVGETRVATWSEFNRDGEDDAARCGESIARRIEDRVFWPPSARPAFDAYAGIFHRGIEESLDPEWVARAERLAKGARS